MVARSYMLEKPPGPSRLARYMHWHATPVAINSLAAAEDQLERFRGFVRRSPAPTIICAFALGAFLANRVSRIDTST